MQVVLSFLAALVVLNFAFRGDDSFSLLATGGIAWGVAFVFIAISFRFQPGSIRSNRMWAMIGAAFLLTLSVVVTRWPVRLGPVIYRSQFQALADRVASGEHFSTARYIGPFTFERGEVERGFVCLWTDLDRAGRSGFIRGSTEHGLPFNAWSVISAGSEWRFVVED
ncbi:MAG: hypothetical protein JWL90_460 [Chthoniobacteraceae bacterium]|nr:hypothetical protein [Chthoniobacteraceae bacterium]